MTARIIAITNQKGGVGKTTTAVNLAASLGAIKHRVLLIDFDPQGNATTGSGVAKEQLTHSIAEVLTQTLPLTSALHPLKIGYDLVPANAQLTAAELQLLKVEGREYFLKRALDPIRTAYEIILIDCPPALNILTVNALVSAHSVLIPMQCEYYALEGLAGLLRTIEQLQRTVNPGLELEGILRTMYDGRSRLTNEVSDQLVRHFANKLYKTVIPRNVRLAEAPSHGMPALLYDSSSQGAITYLALAGEIANKLASTND